IKFKDVDVDKTDANIEDKWHAQVFCWQEKHFNKIERDFYGDIHNCITDLEKIYHEKIKEEESREESSILFTYVHEDGYISEQEIFSRRGTYLQNMVENVDKNMENLQDNRDEFDYTKSLLCSAENTVVQNYFEKMYIMADLGEYVENTWIKNEQSLCTVKFNKVSKVLTVYPDFTTTQPYCINVQSETIRNFYYFIDNCSEEIPETIALKEKELIKKILSARNFEYSDVYVQYFIDLPEDWTCANLESLKGVTQTCHGVNEEGLVHFGHCFEITLEYDIENLQEGIPKTPYIYFEVISKASWDRYRTEGLTYKNLPISNPGCHVYNLSCFRFNTQGPSGNLRRFFIGDCANYNDITWLGVPKEPKRAVFNKFGVNTVGTGQLNIRVNVLHQSQAFLGEFNEDYQRENLIYEKLKSSSLIKSVEQVLQAFRRARRNMIDARKNL
ncbi:hypothetical protein NQ314_007242, partial [Rhamnusium bicolor]